MKRPKRRAVDQRSSDNEKRRLRTPGPGPEARDALARRASFQGSGKHKIAPRAFKLEPASPDADDTFCDGHAGFTPKDMGRIDDLMERGVQAGLLGDRDVQGDPAILWTVDDNGWIYEARITTPTQAIYHGYPLLDGDAFARKVISRYSQFIDANPQLGLERSLEEALERYR